MKCPDFVSAVRKNKIEDPRFVNRALRGTNREILNLPHESVTGLRNTVPSNLYKPILLMYPFHLYYANH